MNSYKARAWGSCARAAGGGTPVPRRRWPHARPPAASQPAGQPERPPAQLVLPPAGASCVVALRRGLQARKATSVAGERRRHGRRRGQQRRREAVRRSFKRLGTLVTHLVAAAGRPQPSATGGELSAAGA